MKKTILSLVVLFCTVTSMNAQQLLKGDMNDDGDLTVGDVTILVDMIKTGERVYIVNPSTGMFEIDNTGLYGTWETSDNESVVIFDETEATYNAKKYSYQYYPNLGKLVLSDKDSEKTKVMLFVDKSSENKIRIFDNGIGDFVEYILSNKVKVESITLSQTLFEMEVGDVSDPIVVTVAPEDATNKEVTWTSNDVTVATVKEGVVTAVAPGTATITCTATDGSKVNATCEVTVKAILITDITLSQSSIKLKTGNTLTIEATINPEDATNKEVTWKSSDVKVATVADGVVTAVAPGTATITCAAMDGSNVKATCEVTVPVEYEYVDLGLRSGTLWATCNIGAEDPADVGDYFAWGEIEPKEKYTWGTYIHCNGASNKQIKYCINAGYWDGEGENPDGLIALKSEDDAATQLWGDEWCMPTSGDLAELNECPRKEYSTRQYNGQTVVGVEIYNRVIGFPSIFIPISGYINNGKITNPTFGYCWSNTNSEQNGMITASTFQIEIDQENSRAGTLDIVPKNRCYGMPIRPVRKK